MSGRKKREGLGKRAQLPVRIRPPGMGEPNVNLGGSKSKVKRSINTSSPPAPHLDVAAQE